MKSRTSFFNKTVFRKNLTRFAPVMVLYTLCLLLGLVMMYADNSQKFWFASHMCQCIQFMALVNLFFGPLMAMLLFGDLFNSRMCNALHAMPLGREELFGTNILSGLVFSQIPTAIMALVSIPLLMNTCVTDAWQIALWWFLGANLEFVCYFGIAVFSVFCTGNRVGMAVVYAAINGGATLAYLIVDMIYTPMLYGVVTSDYLANLLTPMADMVDNAFAEVENWWQLTRVYIGRESEMAASFWLVPETWWNLVRRAVTGVVLMVVGLLMYRRRDLECAGDAVAVPILKPVFQVAFSVAVASMCVILIQWFSGSGILLNSVILYAALGCGLAVGWFGAKMLLERSVRVFGLKNWKGLVLLTVLAVLSVVATKFDVLGVEDWVPKAEKVKSVTLAGNGYSEIELTEQEDIEQIIRLQEMALEDRVQDYGRYPLAYLQSREEGLKNASTPSEGFDYGEDGYDQWEPHLGASRITIHYDMGFGRTVTRSYNIWASLEEGDIVKEYLSRWEVVWKAARASWQDEFDISRVSEIYVSGVGNGVKFPEELLTQENAQSLLDAIKADCEERTMAYDGYYHNGYFHSEEEGNQALLQLNIYTYIGDTYDYTGAYFYVYPDSAHTLQWLEERGLLDFEVVPMDIAWE